MSEVARDFFHKAIYSDTIRPLVRFRADLVLHHYTPDAQAVLNIVATGNLRATNLLFMSDRSELLHALTLTDDVLKQRAMRANGSSRDVMLAARQQLRERALFFPVYATCFCDGELVSHWQNYAHGGGFDLVFTAYAIVYNGSSNAWLSRVEYSLKKQRQLINAAINITVAALDKSVSDTRLRDLNSETRIERAGSALAFALLAIIPAMKDPRFRNEKEWRLLERSRLGDPGTLNFRASGAQLIPYLELQLRPEIAKAATLPLQEIRILRSSNSAERLRALRMLLDGYGLIGTKVVESTVPLRV